jgi:hypothetical protein
VIEPKSDSSTVWPRLSDVTCLVIMAER